MPEREKVIKGLIEIEKIISNGKITICEPEAWSGSIHMIEAAIDLLKEQEAVKIDVKKISDSGRGGRCPNCLMELNEMDYPSYCGFCGQEVKWYD